MRAFFQTPSSYWSGNIKFPQTHQSHQTSEDATQLLLSVPVLLDKNQLCHTVPSSACVWWSGHEAPCQHPVKPWHILTRYLSIEKPHQRSSQNHNGATFLKQIPFNNQTWLDVSPPFLETDDFHNGKPPWNVSQGFPGRRRSPGFDGRLRRRRDYALFGTAPAQPERIPAPSGTMAKRGKSTISMLVFNG